MLSLVSFPVGQSQCHAQTRERLNRYHIRQQTHLRHSWPDDTHFRIRRRNDNDPELGGPPPIQSPYAQDQIL